MLILRGLQRSRPHLMPSMPAFRSFRKTSSAAATASAANPSLAEEGGAKSTKEGGDAGVPVHEGPSTSLPSAGERHISPRVQELVDRIASLSLLDVADLNYALKKRLHIPDQPAMMMPAGMMMAAAQAGAGAAPQADEGSQQEEADAAAVKTSYKLKLHKYDESKKIALIKEMRACTPGMNLVQAKKFIESAPVDVLSDVGLKEAEELKTKLEAQGAVCEIE